LCVNKREQALFALVKILQRKIEKLNVLEVIILNVHMILIA